MASSLGLGMATGRHDQTSATFAPIVPDMNDAQADTAPSSSTGYGSGATNIGDLPSNSTATATAGSGTAGAIANEVVHPGLKLDMRTSNGAHKDGRVRNPIPSRLKGMTDEKNGNFSVMHMDVANRTESKARYEAARQVSESTALQAKLAQTDRYVSLHRKGAYERPARAPRARASSSQRATSAGPEPEVVALETGANRPLTPVETKAEQARLLTLLRTLPHANIVDQICKALAFFGGIPDAPPPADGNFPESAEANGSGSLFVGWIAEIFPDLERPRRPPEVLVVPPTKRPRGRPRGSKATKARKDKGLRKTARAPGDPDQFGEDEASHAGPDDGWADMGEAPMEADPDGDDIERRVVDFLGGASDSGAANGQSATDLATGFISVNGTMEAPAVKRRGRPRGSKNRPKDAEEAPDVVSNGSALMSVSQMATVPAHPKKTAGGRAKGSKNKGKATASTPSSNSQAKLVPPPTTSTSYIPPPTIPPSINYGTAAANRAGSGQNTAAPVELTTGHHPATPQVKESAVAGIKRKRQSNKATGAANSNDGTSATPYNATMTEASPAVEAHATQNNVPGASGDVPAPPSKRPRKPTTVGANRQSDTTGGERDANTVAGSGSAEMAQAAQQPAQQPAQSSDSQATRLSTHFDAQYDRLVGDRGYSSYQQASQQPAASVTQTVSPQPAEGLEAHYERFTAMQPPQATASQATPNSRQQQQSNHRPPSSASQTASPTPSQVYQAPSISTALNTQAQNRVAASYYSPTQTPSYTTHAASYATSQRQHNMPTGSPGPTLAAHVNNSPQFTAQSSNSPLMGADTPFRGSNNFAPRRTPSASPLDNPYRAPSSASHGMAGQSSHYGTGRHTPTTSHGDVSSTYHTFSDPAFLDMSLESATSHSAMALSGSSYNMGPATSQRTSSASNTTGYGAAGMSNGSYDATGVNKAGMNSSSYRAPRWS